MDAKHARKLLARERDRVSRELAALKASTENDQAAREDDHEAGGAHLHDEELGQALAEQLRNDAAAIERAQERLAGGTYGLSVESGEPIPDGRLEAVPWAERTVAEQQRYDSR